MNRRTFLGTMAAAALLPPRSSRASGPRKIQKIGLQLYTVRGELRRDFEGTLAKVAEIGYREVEFAGFFDRSPRELRAMLDRHGLTAPSAHVDYRSLTEKSTGVLDAAEVIGLRYVVCPSVPEEVRRQPQGWKRAAEALNRAGAASLKTGIQFAYHNHEFEFERVNGQLPYDILLAETDRNLVKMEMDLFWITKGGGNPLAYFDRYPGRFPLVHVKGMDRKGNMVDVGEGGIDWERLFAQSEKAGIRHYFVEHDEPKSPFDSIKASFDYVNQLRF